MARTLCIHVGPGKTGTSAVQAALAQDTALAAQGALDLDLRLGGAKVPPELLRQARSPADPAAREAAITDIAARLRALFSDAVHTLVWSLESLFRDREFLTPLIQMLQPDVTVRLAMAVRRQDDWYWSAYQQWAIKHKVNAGPVLPFDEYLARNQFRGDFVTYIRHWREVVGPDNAVVLGYGHDIVERVYAAFGLRPPAAVPQVYPTPTPVAHALYKLFNAQVEGQAEPDRMQRFLAASDHLATRTIVDADFRLGMPTTERLDAVLAHYRDHNRDLLAETGIDLETAPRAYSGDADEVTLNQVLAALLQALVAQSERIARLEATVRHLGTDSTQRPR